MPPATVSCRSRMAEASLNGAGSRYRRGKSATATPRGPPRRMSSACCVMALTAARMRGVADAARQTASAASSSARSGACGSTGAAICSSGDMLTAGLRYASKVSSAISRCGPPRCSQSTICGQGVSSSAAATPHCPATGEPILVLIQAMAAGLPV